MSLSYNLTVGTSRINSYVLKRARITFVNEKEFTSSLVTDLGFITTTTGVTYPSTALGDFAYTVAYPRTDAIVFLNITPPTLPFKRETYLDTLMPQRSIGRAFLMRGAGIDITIKKKIFCFIKQIYLIVRRYLISHLTRNLETSTFDVVLKRYYLGKWNLDNIYISHN